MAKAITFLLLAFYTPVEFSNKGDALSHLNRMNIWVMGSPEYSLSRGGMLEMNLEVNGMYLRYNFNLAEVKVYSSTKNDLTRVHIECEKDSCLQINENRKVQKIAMVMRSAFATPGQDEYKEQYPDKAAGIVDAFEYLQAFYKWAMWPV